MMNARVSQLFSHMYLIGYLLVILSISSASGYVRLGSVSGFGHTEGSRDCFTLREILEYESCPRQICDEGDLAHSQCCMVRSSSGFYNSLPVEQCKCDPSVSCYQEPIIPPWQFSPVAPPIARPPPRPVPQPPIIARPPPRPVPQPPIIARPPPRPVFQPPTIAQPLPRPVFQPPTIAQLLPRPVFQPPTIAQPLPRPVFQPPTIAQPLPQEAPAQFPNRDETLQAGARYCSYPFEINNYKMCPMAFCDASGEVACCKRREFFSVPERCLCHPRKSCDISDSPSPEIDSDIEEHPDLPECKSDEVQPNIDDDNDNTVKEPIGDDDAVITLPGTSDKGNDSKDTDIGDESKKTADDTVNDKTGDDVVKDNTDDDSPASVDKNSKEDDTETGHDEKPSLCAGRLRLLNAQKVEDTCQYKGVAKLTRVDTNGDALVCNAIYTIAQVEGSVRRTFLTPQACGTLTKDVPEGLTLELQIGDQNYPIPSRIFTTAEGPNGNWYITPESRYANLFRDLGVCQSNACPYDPKAMRGKVDFNDCKVVSYGASNADTFETDGLREKTIAFYPGGCLEQDDFFGAKETLCFRTIDDKNAFCANDAGGPVYCRASSTKEWILLGMVAFQKDCDKYPDLKVIPFPL